MEKNLNLEVENIQENKSSGLLGFIEKIGNKMPHPLALFMYIIGITMILSFIVNKLGVTAISPSTGDIITVKNLIRGPIHARQPKKRFSSFCGII